MLSEQITVTTTPTSILDLIALARGVEGEDIASNCTGIDFRYSRDDTAIVSISDGVNHKNPGSSTGAVILDNVNEDMIGTSFDQFNIEKALISCDTGTVIVHIIVTQHL